MSAPSATTEDLRVTGRCYCGAIEFAVHIPAGDAPIFTAYCHCDSCRRAHAAPLYHIVYVEESMFAMTAGADRLTEFRKPGANIVRAFCGECGSRVLNRSPGWTPGGKVPLGFFPNLLAEEHQHPIPDALRPQKQNRPDECVLDMEMLERLTAEG